MLSDLSRRQFLAAAALPFSTPAGAADVLVSSRDLTADIALLHRAYGALHPGLLRYNTQAQLDARFAAMTRWAQVPRSQVEAYAAFARITAAIRCGHSYPNPYNQTVALRTALFTGRDRLPLHFDWIDGRMIVLRDLSGQQILPGTEVLRIGDTRPAALLDALMPLARADGGNDAKRIRSLAVHGQDRWEAFDLYAPMVAPALFTGGSVRLRLRGPGGAERSLDAPLLTGEARRGPAAVAGAADAPLWAFEPAADGVAWLRMPDWGVYKTRWDWQAWLNERLDLIATDGTRALVVDLRGNEGGQDCGDLILSRLIDRDLTVTQNLRLVRYRRTPSDIDPHLETWDDSFRDWGDQAIGPDARGFYRLTRWDDGQPGRDLIRPSGRRFGGKVIVLVDAANSSATFNFAELTKAAGLATLVGQTTGGSRRGINGGAFFFLRLPGSGIEVDVPLVGYFPQSPQPDAGVEPDLRVRRTAFDIATGRDPERAAALHLAQA